MRWRAICWALAVGVIGLAGFAKMLDLSEFARALETWTLIPTGVRPFLVVLVPTIEALASVLWFAGVRRRFITGLLVGVLSVSTLAFGAQVIWGGPPECGWFGSYAAQSRWLSDWPWVLIRNVVLLGMLMPAASSRKVPRPHGPVGGMAAARAFTLVEVVLVVALFGVVAALLVTSLAESRRRAQHVASLANLRSHSQVFSTYSADAKEAWPAFTIPTATYTVLRTPDNSQAVRVPYFGLVWTWHVPMLKYYSVALNDASFRQPYYPQKFGVSYLYPCVFISQPDFWRPETRELPPSQLRGTRVSDVAWASQKVLLTGLVSSSGMSTVAGAREAALCDGHAREVLPGEMEAGYPRNEAPAEITDHFQPQMPPLVHTLRGVRGRDLR